MFKSFIVEYHRYRPTHLILTFQTNKKIDSNRNQTNFFFFPLLFHKQTANRAKSLKLDLQVMYNFNLETQDNPPETNKNNKFFRKIAQVQVNSFFFFYFFSY